MPRSKGRTGRPWLRAAALARSRTTICAWCGHDGAREVDHRVNLTDGGKPRDQANLQVMHGTSCPCPTCGLRCNQVKYWAERRAMNTPPRKRTPKPLTW
jgi:hypothetical protein